MTALPLRPYQEEAIDAVERDWMAGTTRPAVSLPTGTGKTVCFAEHVRREVEQRGRALVLVHRDELLRQTVRKIAGANPDLSDDIGVVKAARDDWDRRVVVASVQTLARKARRDRVPRDQFNLVVVDEAHHAAAKSYVAVLDHFGVMDGRTRSVGFSATLARADGRGLDTVWDGVAYHRDIPYFIPPGWLVDARGHRVTVDGLDLGRCPTSGGEFRDGPLGEAMHAAGAGEAAARAYRRHSDDQPAIMFTPTVATARAWAESMEQAGVPVGVIVGDTPLDERQRLYARFRTGKTRCLVTCMVLAEGFDEPAATVVIVARPVLFSGTYAQIVGRVLRPHPGKVEAIVIDLTGVSRRHQVATMADLAPGLDHTGDGESLMESIRRVGKVRDPDSGFEPVALAGELGSEAFQVLDQSSSTWLRTHGGVWFIPSADDAFFIWPETDGSGDAVFTVGRVSLGAGPGVAQRLHHGTTVGYAMAWADGYARENGTYSSRSSSWRRARPKPRQLAFAQALGIDPGDRRQGEISDMISTELVSRRLDRFVDGR